MLLSETDRVQLFDEQSYFVLPTLFGRAELEALRRVCDAALDAARAASTKKGHTTPKIGLFADVSRFGRDPGALGVLVRFFGSPRVCSLFAGLCRPNEDAMPRLKEADYYHEQTERDWDGDWHRDSQFGQPDPDLERERVLTTTALHVRVALEPDDRLEIVPGSHRRWDTREELRIRKGSHRATPEMPGATQVVLRAGDACVFHAWSIHRATYRRAPTRRTVDALYAFGRARPPS